MANLNPFRRDAPRIDHGRLNAAYEAARAALDLANYEQRRLSLSVTMGEPGSQEKLLAGRQRVQEAQDALTLAEAAKVGAVELEAAQRRQEAQKRQAELDRTAKVAFEAVGKAADDYEHAQAATQAAFLKLVSTFDAAQAVFPGNPHLNENVRWAITVNEAVATEITRVAPPDASTIGNGKLFQPGARPSLVFDDSPDRRKWRAIGQRFRDWTRAAWIK